MLLKGTHKPFNIKVFLVQDLIIIIYMLQLRKILQQVIDVFPEVNYFNPIFYTHLKEENPKKLVIFLMSRNSSKIGLHNLLKYCHSVSVRNIVVAKDCLEWDINFYEFHISALHPIAVFILVERVSQDLVPEPT